MHLEIPVAEASFACFACVALNLSHIMYIDGYIHIHMRRYGDMLRMQNSRVAERRATLTCVSLTCPVLVAFLIFTVMGVCMRIPCLFNMWDRELADMTRHTAQVVIC